MSIKSKVLKNQTKEVYIEGYDFPFHIRQLFSSQVVDIEAIRTRGIDMIATEKTKNDPEVKLNLEEMHRAAYEGNVLAIVYGLVDDEPLSIEDVKQFPLSLVNQLAEAIFELTGVDFEKPEEVEQSISRFR